tara:strand:- start:443 stop:628 length:186 start_codon:yes stop_codon:yes gene_type:complete
MKYEIHQSGHDYLASGKRVIKTLSTRKEAKNWIANMSRNGLEDCGIEIRQTNCVIIKKNSN